MRGALGGEGRHVHDQLGRREGDGGPAPHLEVGLPAVARLDARGDEEGHGDVADEDDAQGDGALPLEPRPERQLPGQQVRHVALRGLVDGRSALAGDQRVAANDAVGDDRHRDGGQHAAGNGRVLHHAARADGVVLAGLDFLRLLLFFLPFFFGGGGLEILLALHDALGLLLEAHQLRVALLEQVAERLAIRRSFSAPSARERRSFSLASFAA